MFTEKEGTITYPTGFTASGVKAGVKQSGKEDIAVIYSSVPAQAAAVFTQNLMAAAPVIVSKETLASGTAQAIVVNSGCANACSGEQGLADAKEMAQLTAEKLGIAASEVFVASTGVIGVAMPMDKIRTGITAAVGSLAENGGENAVKAIMTTDTFAKSIVYDLTLGGKTVKIAGIAKGAGMIHPNMATMLGFITTDAAIAAPVLQAALKAAVQVSFNMVSVDGDTSTNDMVILLANGLAENGLIDSVDHADFAAFQEALTSLCTYLAKQIAHDGEGATKFLELTVKGAKDFAEGKQVAMAVAKSPLVKTAFFGEDPNWGRILCAVGYSGVPLDPTKVSLAIGGVPIVKAGLGAAYDEKALRDIMAESDIQVEIDLAQGDTAVTVWSCDFSYEYVKINGEYHT
ncbi:MAG: bifunctional glutamate N-acetyltransferase/amino-acid acetyltransferase ArgJ [Sporomusaceae bacterium]|nr:bifunctional glutamate N-acetyltransferase/amino-acid acetyltransferase ArgJ [Sporomusaceae bacterium]